MSEQNQETNILEPQAFQTAIVAGLAALDEVQVLKEEEFSVQLQVGGVTMRFSLENLYRAYTTTPQPIDQLVQSIARALRAQSKDRSRLIDNYEELKTRVYPMLKPINLLAYIREQHWPMLVYRPFLADLIITYVIDEPQRVAYINEQHLERWQISEHILHEQAIRNLAERTNEETNYTAVGDGAQRLIVFNCKDGYDATRLLLPDTLNKWRTEFPGQMVIGIPNRDFLLIFSDSDKTILASVAQQIQADSASLENGLTEQLFTLVNGEIREYVWE